MIRENPNPKKKSAPPMKPKGIIIGSSVASSTLTSEKEEPILKRDDIITQPVNVPVEGMTEEEHSALPLKASIDTALDELVAQVASFIYERAPSVLNFL